jgi:hypothetical protein
VKLKTFVYRLFFTRDDDLDILQLLFIASTLFFGVAFALAGLGWWSVSNAAWAAFGGVFATLAIAGTPKWVAQLLATSPTPAALAKAIGEAKEYGGPTPDGLEP